MDINDVRDDFSKRKFVENVMEVDGELSDLIYSGRRYVNILCKVFSLLCLDFDVVFCFVDLMSLVYFF